jgi:hypothetical protein
MFNDGIFRDLWTKDDYSNGWDTIWQPSTNRLVFRDTQAADTLFVYTYTPGTKVLVTFTVNDTTNKTSLYINDSFIASGSNAVNAFNAASLPLKFGWNANTDATYFKGAISDLLVYNKELSSTEVNQSYYYLNSL